MPKKNYVSGFGEKDPDIESFLKPSAGSDAWTQKASQNQYNARWDDDTGDVRGDTQRHSSATQNTWDDEANTAAFLKASQTRTDHGDGRDEVDDIFSDVMADQGPGPYGAGGSSVKEVGGGSGPPRFKPKSSKQARDDQSNDGL